MSGARSALAVLFFINLMNFFDRQILGAVGEQIRREWGLGDTALGALIREQARGTVEASDIGTRRRAGSPYTLLLSTPTLRWIIVSGRSTTSTCARSRLFLRRCSFATTVRVSPGPA